MEPRNQPAAKFFRMLNGFTTERMKHKKGSLAYYKLTHRIQNVEEITRIITQNQYKGV